MTYKQAVNWFRDEMLQVLEENDHKEPISREYLIKDLFGEAFELHKEMLATIDYEPDAVVKEAVDVANFALMVALDAKGKHLPKRSERINPALVRY